MVFHHEVSTLSPDIAVYMIEIDQIAFVGPEILREHQHLLHILQRLGHQVFFLRDMVHPGVVAFCTAEISFVLRTGLST